jgi:hypothetical protein
MILDAVTFAAVGETPPFHGGLNLPLGHRRPLVRAEGPGCARALPELSSLCR